MRRDVFGFKPTYDFAPLSSLSVIFRQARYSPAARKGAPVKIIDCWATDPPSQFISDNFGTYYVSRGGSQFPSDALAAANLMTIVPPERQTDPKYGVPRDLIAIPDDAAAFSEFVARRATSLSLASALFSPRLDIRDIRWSGSFGLVVGESFSDRILFWNSRLFIPSWLDSDICCFRVTLDQLRQPGFVSTLGDLLKHRNFVNGGSGGQSRVTLRSLSLSTEDLEAAKQLIAGTKPWGPLDIEQLDSLDAFVPAERSLAEARDVNHFDGSFFKRPDWTQFTWSPPVARPPTKVPDHLSDAPPRQFFTQGFWCADFAFDCEGPGPRLGRGNRWMLPKRWRMAGSFKSSLVGDAGPATVPPAGRRSRGGNLSIFVSTDHPLDTIEVPTPYRAMAHALAVDGRWSRPDAEHGDVHPSGKVSGCVPQTKLGT
jgi:hypothetical protein